MRIEKQQGDLLSQRLAAAAKANDKVLQQLATGKRINQSSDDAAGIAAAREFEQQLRSFRGASENISTGMSALSIADGGASNISDMLQRQQELAAQSANGVYTDDQRASMDNEFQSLSQEINRVSKSTDFNGQNLLDGSSQLSDGTGNIQAGDGSSDQIALPATDLSVSGLNLGAASLSSSKGALSAMAALDAAMRKVNDSRSSQGALQGRLDSALSEVQTQTINTTQGLSQIEDLDYAKGLTEKASADILQNTSAAALSQFNQLSRTHLLALLQ